MLSTYWDDDPTWVQGVDLVDRRLHGKLRCAWEFLRRAPNYDVAIIVGSLGLRDLYADLVMGALLKLRRRRPVLVVTDATWSHGSAALSKLAGGKVDFAWLASLVVRVLDSPSVHYCVLSRSEEAHFSSRWGVDPHRVHFTPFFFTLEEHLEDPVSDGGYIFSGGNSLRDYDLLLSATAGLDFPVRVATNWRPPRPWPNAQLEAVDHDRFIRLMLGATMVVVPLVASERSAGQQTYLNSMAAGKLTIVTDSPGARDYIEDRVNGLICAPEPDALRDAIEWALDPANEDEVRRICSRGRRDVRERFSPARYHQVLLGLAGELALSTGVTTPTR